MASGRVVGTTEQNNGKDEYSFFVDWVSTPNYNENYSLVTASMRFGMGSEKLNFKGLVNRTASITINGYTQSITKIFELNYWPEIENPNAPEKEQRRACTVYTCNPVKIDHNDDGTKIIEISAYVDLETDFWTSPGECKCKATRFDLDSIPRTPSAPTNLSLSMDRNYSVYLSWGAASGYVTGYLLEYCRYDPNTDTYFDWYYMGQTTNTSWVTSIDAWPSGTGIGYRVRALNGTLQSDWATYTGWVYRKGGLYVNSGGERKFGTVYAPGTPPVKAKGVFIGNANGVPVESIRTTDEKNRPIL